ncbi:MAG: family transposase [Caballeronia mineralivorans]|jgi:hypothetical protein|nr:family transposase [Caballeronia mineralivorans]MEA3102620.1 transposase [Caballeronia mineralivorans]
MLSLHRMRSLLVKFRTMQVNRLRGLLYEFGKAVRAARFDWALSQSEGTLTLIEKG